ncbi:MAG: RNA polymerase sigma factor RpoD/SigA [Candidatus Latescibacteria bacterium]|nr:RNA polymerase sigma factor RpoD/SigA [Candidatus Latescibacterota bacterium]
MTTARTKTRAKARKTSLRPPGVPTSTEVYWREIQRYRPLSRAEEADLVQRARQGDDEASQKLVQANLRFVVSVAKHYANHGLSFIELVSEGNYGLMEAVKRFDETRGFKFITYAVWWIRQAILKALAEQGKIARPPMSQLNDLQKVEKQTSLLAQRLGRDPTLEEVAASAKISLDRARNALETGQRDLSLDMPVYPGEEDSLLSIFDAGIKSLEEDLERDHLNQALRTSMKVLDAREHQIIRAYFGLDGSAPMTLEKIGEGLSLTRERVRQLRDRALEKIRLHCGEKLLELSRN